ncbi:MAG TPA: hypothetical protein VGH80_09810 [Xanthomonadaceae bacterium]|jgi:hypothetical protein
MISDPSQLLQRIPELESLASDPKIRDAIASGDPFKVYRALFWAKWLRRFPALRAATVSALLRKRRLFARPIKRSPGLGTLNSIGFSFVGSSDREKDGTYVALHAFVFFFAIPLVPLGAYLVSSEGSRRYRIYARVPLGAMSWLYTRGLSLLLVGAIGVGLFQSFWSSRNQDVTILNGFDEPVAVEIAGHKASVPAQGHIVINVPAGKVAGIAKARGNLVVDQLDTDVHAEAVYAVWNIAGAAPLVRRNVIYVARGSERQHNDEGSADVLCGKRYQEAGSVDYAFTKPPDSIEMPSHSASEIRSSLDVIVAPKMTQSMTCTAWAAHHDHLGDMAGSLAARAAMSGWKEQDLGLALMAASQKSPADALKLARQASDARPDDVDVQRFYLRELDVNGQIEQARKDFAARASRQPESPVAQYLAAVLMRGGDSVSRLGEASRKFDQPYMLRTLVWREWVNARNEDAVRDWDRLNQKTPDMAGEVFEAEIGAQLALHHAQQALRTIADAFAAAKDPNQMAGLASDYALVAGASGGDRETLFAQLRPDSVNPEMVAYQRARAGLDPDARFEHDKSLVQMAIALRQSSDQAVAIAGRLNRVTLLSLAPEHWALLYAEALRTGNQPLQDKLATMADFDGEARDRLRDFVAGKDVQLDGLDINPETRAAASLVRSENTALSTSERKSLRAHAASADLEQNVIATAARQWTF